MSKNLPVWKAVLLTVIYQLTTIILDAPSYFIAAYRENPAGSYVILLLQLLLYVLLYGSWCLYIIRQTRFQLGYESGIKLKLILLIFVIFMGFHLFSKPFFYLYEYIRTAGKTKFGYFPGSWEAVFKIQNDPYMLSLIIVAPLVEELFFRRFLLKGLRQKYGTVAALLISSLLFCSIHWPDYNNLLPTFTMGLVAGLIYLWSGKILYSILFHVFLNSVYFYLAYSEWGGKYHLYFSKHALDPIFWLSAFAGLLLLTAGLLTFRKLMAAKHRYH